jgi:hypothetical protein
VDVCQGLQNAGEDKVLQRFAAHEARHPDEVLEEGGSQLPVVVV